MRGELELVLNVLGILEFWSVVIIFSFFTFFITHFYKKYVFDIIFADSSFHSSSFKNVIEKFSSCFYCLSFLFSFSVLIIFMLENPSVYNKLYSMSFSFKNVLILISFVSLSHFLNTIFVVKRESKILEKGKTFFAHSLTFILIFLIFAKLLSLYPILAFLMTVSLFSVIFKGIFDVFVKDY